MDSFLVEMNDGGVCNSLLKDASIMEKHAKIETAKRIRFAAIVEFYVGRIKIYLKTLVS